MALLSARDQPQLSPGTNYFVNYIKNRIKHRKNFLFPITGQTGSGKSYGAISLYNILADGKMDLRNVCLRAEEFMARLNSGELKPGDVIIWDEAGVDLNAKQWQSLTNRVVNFVLQTFRHKNLIVIFTLPYLSFLDSDARKLIHGYAETQSINFKNSTLLAKPFLLQINQRSGQTYAKYLRVKPRAGPPVPVKGISLPLVDKKFLDEYEIKREQFTTNLNAEIAEMLRKMRDKKLKIGKQLTDRMNLVMKLKAKGLSNSTIAEYLNLERATISEVVKLAEKRKEYLENPIGMPVST